MKTFRTVVNITPSPSLIGLKNSVLTAGSCFAEAIGDRLKNNKFTTLVNPFGVIYNPVSIHKALHYAIHQEPPAEHTYLKQKEIIFNYDFHSQLSGLNKEGLSATINNLIGAVHYSLKDADLLLITYGTAWVYQRKDSGEVVANCHKMPADTFTKSLLSDLDIIESFESMYNALMKFNPKIRIILTVSPVRHIKDTLELNSVSKALLRVACHRLSEKYKSVAYFPAYEIMMDDLRDYRFYKSDMLHPTEEAEDYIWEKFAERFFTADAKIFIKQWQSITAALEHKPFHPNSESHQQFLKETLKKLESLKPVVNVEKEILMISEQMT